MLSSANRLKKRKEFAYLYNNGKAKHTSFLTMVYLPTKSRVLKIGFSVAKKVGKAHVRNLVKRRLRSIMREFVGLMPNNFNVVFIAKVGIDKVPYEDLKSQVKLLLTKGEFIK